MDDTGNLNFETLESWVMSKCDAWRDHYEANYAKKHDEYYRIWRGIWAEEDKTRQSERSRIVSPATQQAVESSIAEIEEATFGRGRWFDVADDMNDKDAKDVQYLRRKLYEDFTRVGIRKDIAECILNAAIFGNGMAEVVIDEIKDKAPAEEPIIEGQLTAIGVNITDRTVVKLRPVMPKNFLIDPVASNIDDALGCATDEFVSTHQVEMLIESGVYRNVPIQSSLPDDDIEPDPELSNRPSDKVRLTKYYGLVPRHLLQEATTEEDEEIVTFEDQDDSFYVEAIVVMSDGGNLLKAEENPYMMQDRPVVAFQWDTTPGVFWGRGVCEKAYNSQRALDAELRARIDALALTVHPMMGVDATRLPRGHKLEVRPGKMLLTNGDPREILHPFNFGNVQQITFSQAAELQTMVQQSTGAVDSAGIAGSINGEATAAGISMSLGAIIKRQKRTLINFQDGFLIPFVRKAAWRYMQFDPENYPVRDYKFVVTSSLGIMAREYEVTQLVQLLQTTSPDSPIYPLIVTSIIENMNISNREEMVEKIIKASQPTPEQQQAQKAQQAQAEEMHKAQLDVYMGQAAESMARGKKYSAEAEAVPAQIEIDKLRAITTNLKDGDKEDIEFERRYKIAEFLLKEKEHNIKKEEFVAKRQEAMNESELLKRMGVGQ